MGMKPDGAKIGRAPLIIWRFIDGKPGHQNQTAGLVQALVDRVAVDSHDIIVRPDWRNWLGLLTARCPLGRGLPDPDILLGAGHATHVALLACKRARGGRTVVLMQPSLPRQWFDLCIVPSHDGVPPGERVDRALGVRDHRSERRQPPARCLGREAVGRHTGCTEPAGRSRRATTRRRRSWRAA